MKASTLPVLGFALLTAWAVTACGGEDEPAPADVAAEQAQQAQQNSRDELEDAAADQSSETVGSFEDEREQARDGNTEANVGSSGTMQQAERANQINNPEANSNTP
ncbi:hypothetical protein [Kushneria aurantia]|uniref:Secreted protein n=1 Tax=Kushneria aurantia TaxID=504092 RepID=A0ABV6G6I9_9GAMM|nr:hypothetical protein [Kushneria aurantia]